MTRISADEADELLRTFDSEWVRYEARAGYAIGEELEEFRAFLDGKARMPSQIGWWAGWLEWAASQTAPPPAGPGKAMSRVRLIGEDGPTDYQRWQIFAAPWYARARITIRYLGRRRASQLGLPLDGDWSLLDSRRVIIHEYSETDEITGWTLVTDPAVVARYIRWRDIALQHATAIAPGRAA